MSRRKPANNCSIAAEAQRSELMQTLTNILYIKGAGVHPDKLLDWMLPHLQLHLHHHVRPG